MTAGYDGNTVTSTDLINGWANFISRDTIDVRILINCGYAIPAVQQYMANIAINRSDCIAVARYAFS